MARKTIALVLALVMTLSLCSVTAFAGAKTTASVNFGKSPATYAPGETITFTVSGERGESTNINWRLYVGNTKISVSPDPEVVSNGKTEFSKQITIATADHIALTHKATYLDNGNLIPGTYTVKVVKGNGTELTTASFTVGEEEAQTYTVTLDANGGTVTPTSLTHTYGTATNLPEPAKTGFNFNGWYMDNNTFANKVESIGATAISTNTTLYAKWTAKTYTVTLDANGGTVNGKATDTVIHTYGTDTTLPTNVTKADHYFKGWFDNEACTGTAVKVIPATTAAGGEFWAKWEACYKTGVEHTFVFTGDFSNHNLAHVKMLDAATGKATGTDFAKNTDPNVSVTVTDTKVTIVTGPNAAPGTYLCYRGSESNPVGTFTLVKGLTVEEYTLGEVEYIRYDYTTAANVLHIKSYDPATGAIGEEELKGNFNVQIFTDSVRIYPTENTQSGTYICYHGMKTNVIGAFKLNPAPVVVPRPDTVPYDLLGEALTIEYTVPAAYTDITIHMYAVDDEDVKLNSAPTADLYHNGNSDFAFRRSGDKLTITVAAAATPGTYVIYHGAMNNYENWIGAFSLTLKHTVTFDANGGAAVATATVIDGEAIAEPLSLKDNVTPYCWTDEDGNVWDFATPITEDVTLTAQRVFPYNQENSMKVYNEDETVTNRTENYHIYNVLDTEQANDLANAAGFKVTGAFKDADGAFYVRVKTNQGGVTTPAGIYNVVFWNPTTHAREVVGTFTVGYQYTVTFDSKSGSAVAPLTVWEGETITAPTAPTKAGYNFAGWYKDRTTAWDFATDVVSADVTLYAKWTPVHHHHVNTQNTTVQSGKTFDAGIALYAGLALMSATGSAVVIGKKKEF